MSNIYKLQINMGILTLGGSIMVFSAINDLAKSSYLFHETLNSPTHLLYAKLERFANDNQYSAKYIGSKTFVEDLPKHTREELSDFLGNRLESMEPLEIQSELKKGLDAELKEYYVKRQKLTGQSWLSTGFGALVGASGFAYSYISSKFKKKKKGKISPNNRSPIKNGTIHPQDTKKYRKWEF